MRRAPVLRRPRVRVGSAASVAAAIAVSLGGCGYGFSAGVGRLPAGAESVYVRALEAHTTDAEVGALVAAALRRELARRGADGGPTARARIEGAVEDTSFAASTPTGASRVGITVSVALLVDGAVVAEQRSVRRDEDYLAGQDPLESEGRRRLALRRAAEVLARDIVERFERP